MDSLRLSFWGFRWTGLRRNNSGRVLSHFIRSTSFCYDATQGEGELFKSCRSGRIPTYKNRRPSPSTYLRSPTFPPLSSSLCLSPRGLFR